MIHLHSPYLDFLSIPNSLISFQSKWSHMDSSFIHNNNHIISTILKLMGTCVIKIPWFPFNPQYTGFILTKMITYEPITQSSHIPHKFNHTEAYKCMCNYGTLISFQSVVHWFHFNQNDYTTKKTKITDETNSSETPKIRR